MASDDASLQAAGATYDSYMQAVPAVLYAGPFTIQGTLTPEDKDVNEIFLEERGFVPVINAVIDCQLPGAKLTGYRMPWMLLNGGLLHGYGMSAA